MMVRVSSACSKATSVPDAGTRNFSPTVFPCSHNWESEARSPLRLKTSFGPSDEALPEATDVKVEA
jgi:hypothetical protein